MQLAHELAADEVALQVQADAVIAEFLKAGPEAAKAAKQLIRDVGALMHGTHGMANHDSGIMEHTCKTIAHLRVGKEGQEGMSALLEKRKPLWCA